MYQYMYINQAVRRQSMLRSGLQKYFALMLYCKFVTEWSNISCCFVFVNFESAHHCKLSRIKIEKPNLLQCHSILENPGQRLEQPASEPIITLS